MFLDSIFQLLANLQSMFFVSIDKGHHDYYKIFDTHQEVVQSSVSHTRD